MASNIWNAALSRKDRPLMSTNVVWTRRAQFASTDISPPLNSPGSESQTLFCSSLITCNEESASRSHVAWLVGFLALRPISLHWGWGVSWVWLLFCYCSPLRGNMTNAELTSSPFAVPQVCFLFGGKHSGDKYGDYIPWGYQFWEEGVGSIENMASNDLTAHFPASTSYHCHVQTLRTSWDEVHLHSTGKLEISLSTGSPSSECLP